MKTTTSQKMKARGIISSAVLGMVILLLPTLASAQSLDQDITFSRDIMPILQDNCQECHRAEGIGPMPLMSYDDAKLWAPLIQLKVINRQMPPWHIDRTIGLQKFKNDRSLSDEQVEMISSWVNAGAPEGNPADLPPASQFSDSTDWSIGTPDVIVNWEYTVPASGPDLYGDIFTTDLIGKMQNGRYIKAIQTRAVDDADAREVTLFKMMADGATKLD